jgi:adenine phosphoribosyltransferase
MPIFSVKLKHILLSMNIEEKIKNAVRDVPNFPREGIMFKDITPILKDVQLCKEITESFAEKIRVLNPDVIVGIESRGFLFGMLIARELNIPFVPIRKKGKLPADCYAIDYDLEYGSACIEIHKDAIKKGDRVVIHDDLLATGGTVIGSSQLILMTGAEVVAFSFIIGLDFLGANEKLLSYSPNIITLANY